MNGEINVTGSTENKEPESLLKYTFKITGKLAAINIAILLLSYLIMVLGAATSGRDCGVVFFGCIPESPLFFIGYVMLGALFVLLPASAVTILVAVLYKYFKDKNQIPDSLKNLSVMYIFCLIIIVFILYRLLRNFFIL